MKKRDSRVTLLDVCQATQKDLERFFREPGRCFGDLRRTQLMMEQMTKRTLQMYHAMAHASIGFFSMSSDAFMGADPTRDERPEQSPAGGEPRFCGGPLEKTQLSWCDERDKDHRREQNIPARNAKKRRNRSSRVSPRTRGRASS